MANLILVRHGESLWNGKGLWTGWTDISLDDQGKNQARLSGESIKKLNIAVDIVYTSTLKRARETFYEIKNILKLNVLTFENSALNERNYGIYTGKSKWEIEKEVGEEQFHKIRRGWDISIENGESLKDVYERVIPYYQTEILPKLKSGKNILIVAHGNSLRALVKYLDNISNEDVENLEIATGEVYLYSLDEQGAMVSKQIITSNC